MITGNTNATVLCSVVFVDIIGFSKLSVQGQIAAKERFKKQLSVAIGDIPVDERIVLDTGDGGSVSFLHDPEPALLVALRLRAAERDSGANAVRIGINLGPAQIVQDLNGQPNLIGDGINTAERIMSFSPPGGIFVSRSYFEAVSRLTDEYQTLFESAGVRADKHGRPHEVFAVGEMALASIEARMASKHDMLPELPGQEEAPAPAATDNGSSTFHRAAEFMGRWFLPAFALAASAALIAAGVAQLLPGGELTRIGVMASAAIAMILITLGVLGRGGAMAEFPNRIALPARLQASRASALIWMVVTATLVGVLVLVDQARESPPETIRPVSGSATSSPPLAKPEIAARPGVATETSAAAGNDAHAGPATPIDPAAATVVPAADTNTATDTTPDKGTAITPHDRTAQVPDNAAHSEVDASALRKPAGTSRGAAPKHAGALPAGGANARCSNMINRVALGETLSREEQELLRTHCK